MRGLGLGLGLGLGSYNFSVVEFVNVWILNTDAVEQEGFRYRWFDNETWNDSQVWKG